MRILIQAISIISGIITIFGFVDYLSHQREKTPQPIQNITYYENPQQTNSQWSESQQKQSEVQTQDDVAQSQGTVDQPETSSQQYVENTSTTNIVSENNSQSQPATQQITNPQPQRIIIVRPIVRGGNFYQRSMGMMRRGGMPMVRFGGGRRR